MGDTTTELEPKQTAATGTAAVLQQDDGFRNQANGFLALFQRKPISAQEAARAAKKKAETRAIKEAITAAKTGDVKAYIDARFAASPEGKKKLFDKLIKSSSARKLLTDPTTGGLILGETDPDQLSELNFDKLLGDKKNGVLASALIHTASLNTPPTDGDNLDRANQTDPKLVSLLGKHIDLATWNAKGSVSGPSNGGLSTKIYQRLWKNGCYDQICELIERGVDTTQPTYDPNARGKGCHSGFIQPLQHMIQPALHDVGRLDAGELPKNRERDAEGAKAVFAALDKTGVAQTVTKWSQVKGSELLDAFINTPGTIWGFESVREPYIDAAHETDEGGQPVRMLEIWEAVEKVLDSLESPDAYSKFLDDPDSKLDAIVSAASDKVKADQNKTSGKYGMMAGWSDADQKAYRERFRKDAKAFLKEFAAQMPKGMFNRFGADEDGEPDADQKRLSEIAGIKAGPLAGGLACKAGLWWAKSQKKPVYYCLDGINIKDATDYKKLKNAAIDQYLASGEKADARHHEVITMVEIREILKNWDELEETVIFTEFGNIIPPEEAAEKVKQWQADMKAANKAAGRAKAPPRAKFENELNALDPELMGRLDSGEEGDKDARDIARKSSYLAKVANVRPAILLKYIMSKCYVLVKYDLISETTVAAAKIFSDLASDKKAPEDKIKQAASNLIELIGECNAKFQDPLKKALVRHPLIQRAESKKKPTNS